MSSSAVAGLCRLRFRAPESVFELAVPTDVPLADLLPAIIGHAGADLRERGVEHGGWILQRLGGEPLDEELTTDPLSLHDGDELYLRPRRDALPPVHFDDLVDGVAAGMRERGDTWRPAMTHHLAVGLGLCALAAGFVILLLPGPSPVRELAAAVTAALLLLGAASASRAVGDSGAGTALGAASVPFLSLAAVQLPTGGTGPVLLGARLIAGASAAAGAAVLAMAAVGWSAPFFMGIVATAVLAAVAGWMSLLGLSLVQVAAVSEDGRRGVRQLHPGDRLQLSGLRLPALPRNAEELQEEIEPFPAGNVIARSAIADAYLTSFYMAVGAVSAVCVTLLSTGTGWVPPMIVGTVCLLLLLHARPIGSVRQRLAVLLPAAYGLVLLAAGAIARQDRNGRLLALAGLLAVAVVLLVIAWTIPGRRLVPYWGRAADMLHTLAAASAAAAGAADHRRLPCAPRDQRPRRDNRDAVPTRPGAGAHVRHEQALLGHAARPTPTRRTPRPGVPPGAP